MAVVFFHGIGQQRRYETTASLLEALDDCAFTNANAKDAKFPAPRLDVKTRIEQLKNDSGQPDGATIVYQQADYEKARVRFYEGFWAPATVMGTTAPSVIRWLMLQLLRPIAVLIAPWRAYARLRRGDLFTWCSTMPAANDRDARRLVSLYSRFVRQKDAASARFKDFLAFIEEDREDKADPARLKALATKWRRWHTRQQWLRLATLALAALSVVAGLTLFLIGLLAVLEKQWHQPLIAQLVPTDAKEPGLKEALMLAGVIANAIGINSFLRNYVGDIQQFVTYEEAQPLYERRQKILDMGIRTLKHVLKDDLCERVVIVGHSLGTAVALDTVLQLRVANQAANPSASTGEVMKGPLPLNRIQSFITFGSPIDKINYFFATRRSVSRSYESLVEVLRGDISSVPFSGGGRQPYVHWINFWDRGDPISDPIETVAGDLVRKQHVDNVQVCSYLWPDPAAAHSGYFSHNEVVRTIFGVAFFDELSFANYRTVPGTAPKLPWIGPGASSALQRILLLIVPVVAVLLIWTTAALLIPALPGAPVTALGVLSVLLIGGIQIQRWLGLHRASVRTR